MTWTRDGEQVVVTTGNKLVVYDANDLTSFTEREMPQEVTAVRSLPTERAVALGMTATIRFATTQGKFLTTELRGGAGAPSSIAQSSNGRRVAAGFVGSLQGALGNVAVWDQESGRLVTTAPVYGPVTRVAFNNQGNALLIASAVNSCSRGGGGVFLWRFAGEPELVFDVNGNSVTDLAVSPAQNIAATITQHGKARCLGPAQVDVWDIETRQVVNNISFPQDATALAFSPDGEFLAIGTRDGQVHLWDMHAQQTVQEFQIKPDYFVRVAFSPDGKSLAAATPDAVKVWSINKQ
jgi:WD40 repeat protein